MRFLYLDNFRGFSNTIIPLKSVNFLVGENSTGKTSILALLDRLSSSDFWFFQDFNSADYEFGGFKDILSVSSTKDESEFTFGLCEILPDEESGGEKLICYLVSYREKEGLPIISFFSRLFEEGIVASAKLYNDRYTYMISNIPAEQIKINAPDLFCLLKKGRNVDIRDYKAFSKNLPTSAGFTLYSLIHDALAPSIKPREFETMFPRFCSDMAWLAPIRTKPKRTYDGYRRSFSPEGEHTPHLLRRGLSAGKKEAESFKSALDEFGKASGLFKQVIVNELGSDSTSPFELLIVLSDNPLRINSVGYGVSQVLPLVVEMLARPKNSWFAIQQPEVHLHPRAQAALGDLIFAMAEHNEKYFLIETHSDFTIDRFRLNYRKSKNHHIESQVLFFERTDSGNKVSVIPILENGEYSTEQPSTFRDFFLKEQMELLGI